jgi:ribonuclease R
VPFSVGDELTPKDYQQVSERLRELKNGRVLQISLLRSMNQAVYSIENEGHFGLAYQEYTHFTSPIRRYPDLLTHRLIKSVIHSNNEDKTTLRLGSASKNNFYPYDKAQMVNLGVQTSYTERRAEAAVYEVLEWIKCDYVSDRVGDILEGVITGVTKFGFFVELNDIFVEGLVHISTLKGDYYQYDQGAQCLVGERTNEVYGMGDGVQAQISRVNVDERKIDFELVSHSPLARKAPTGKSFDKKPGRNRSKKSDVAKKTDSKRKRGKPDRRKKAEPQSNVARTKAAKSKSSKPKSAATGAPKVAKEGASQNAAQGSAKAKKGKARKPKLSRGPKNTAGDKPKGR